LYERLYHAFIDRDASAAQTAMRDLVKHAINDAERRS
jgi:DNA-binding FadR family transcriptional regulator